MKINTSSPTDGDFKTAYPNVTGLFRVNDDGYYEFRSWKTFAELNVDQKTSPKTSTGNNHITLYDKIWGWGLPDEHDGQFFPFNDWSDMFFVDPSGNLVQAHQNDTVRNIDGGAGQTTTDEPLNHYFGMTIETKFRQPTDGILDRGAKKEPMKFEFSGDDDIWIFIDDVLVGDLGGIHGWKDISIDFSTGEVVFVQHTELNTTLADMFDKAGVTSDWKTAANGGKIFADNSTHILKFFYLERGNQYSNCNITFNLQEPIADHIRKVDENGDALAGATFDLYAASGPSGGSEWWRLTSDQFRKTTSVPITTTTSNGIGYASLTDAKGDPLDLSAHEYYILEETGTPVGYRKNPPIVLKYHSDTKTLTVVNKYEVGAYASFLADWKQTGTQVDLADFDQDAGTFSNIGTADTDELKKGLSIIVPIGNVDGQWLPVYGSNTYGWHTVTPQDDFVKALAAAAIMQIADPETQDWYLRWNEAESCLKGHIENLPGDATRYGADGDIKLVTLFLSEDALAALSLTNTYTDDDARYAALKKALEGTDENTAERLAESLSDLKILYTEGFEKISRTVIYVPNEQRELRVRKVNESGTPVGGSVFALFDTAEHAAAGKTTTSEGVLAYGTAGRNGEIIFRANGLTSSEADYGYAKMNWSSSRTGDPTAVYWLKEISAPSGYELNKNLIRVEVGNAGIYANATGFDANGVILEGASAANDGIRVEASLGDLTQTLVKYAEGIVDETLTNITATKQTASSSGGALNIDSWRDVNGDEAESNELTYKVNGYDPAATFTAENDYIRVMPRQAAKDEHTAKRDDLTGIDLDGLFGLINTVVVTDRSRPDTDGSMIIDKSDDPDKPEELDDPEEPNGSDTSDEQDTKPDENPKTEDEARLHFGFIAITLSLIAAANPLRKRGKLRK